MRQSVYKFYKGGTDTQKRADIVFDFKRPDAEKVMGWSVTEKILAQTYINEVKEKFKRFIEETEKLIK